MTVKVSIKAGGSAKVKGILRLRKAIREANHLAQLRMTGVGSIVILLGMLSATAWATTYYVSSSTGSDGNNGTSSATPWQTIAHVNGQTFQPGDSILFKRGDVWNESLTPPSSGSSGDPIAFDAYGTGAAPNLTGYYAVPATAWVLVTGNAWKAPVPSTYTAINFCLFGSIWGQKVSAVSSNLTAQWDFYLANGYVYVYSVGNPAAYYNEPIVPMALSNVPVINTNGQSWLTFQHFLVNWFDDVGVYVQGTSDHLVLANMEADAMIPEGTQPLGFYVDESAPGPGDIKIYNAEAHLNYDGFRFDGAATAITMVNDKGYSNRDGALVDNTGAVSYSYCHFYASSLAVAGSTDVEWTSGSGPMEGAGNIAADTAPAVEVYQRYPARVTLTVDDSGMTPGADTYYASTVLPVADAAGVPVGAAITVGYPLAQTLISEFQGWINAGRDVASHSISHTYYTNTDALDIQYSGSGTAATLSISGNTLTITVTGASDGVSYNLAQGQPEGTILGLAQALAATGKYTYSFLTPCQGPYGTGCSAYTAAALLSQDLADVSGQDVKSAAYHMQLNVTQLTTDEITLSRRWMTSNLTGLPATPVYVYPGGYETTAMQGIAEGVPYEGARGALKEDIGVKDTYADGFNAENVTSFGVNPSWMGLEPTVLNQKIQALVWKESVWGVPWGIFWHLNELTQDDPVGGTEIANLMQDFKASGATIQTNTSLVNWLLSGVQETGTDGNYYYKFPATSNFSSGGGLDFRPTRNSPVVDAGQNLGAAYELDINGVNQNSYGSGWEIGAHVYQGYAMYGGGQSGTHFAIGEGEGPNYSQARQDVNIAPLPSPIPTVGGLTGAGTVVTPTDFSLPICRLSDATFDPSIPNHTMIADAGGSGDETLFNTNSTLAIIGGSGGQGYPISFSFNGTSCTVSRLYASNPSWTAHGGWYFTNDDPGWSYVNPFLLFIVDPTNPAIDSYNMAGFSPMGTPPSNVTLFDFRAGQTGAWGTTSSNCLPSNYTMTWSSYGKQNKATNSLAADQVFAMGLSNAVKIAGSVASGTFTTDETVTQSGTGATAKFHFIYTNMYVDTVTGSPNNSGTWTGGTSDATFTPTAVPVAAGQDYGTDAVAFKVGGGCAYLNTLTGVVTSDFGPVGTVSNPDRFTVHNAKISKDGSQLLITPGFCLSGSCANQINTPYQWSIGTTTLNNGCVAPNDCSGHFTEGYSHFVNNDGSPSGQQIVRPYGNNTAPTVVPMGLPWAGSNCTGASELDQHQNWTNVDPLDSLPFFTTTVLAAPPVSPYVCAGSDEIQAVSPGTGTVWRFAHTYNSDQNVLFQTAQAIGAVSQDGNYFLWGSDWEGTLGSTSGGSSCTLTTNCRGDVFMVLLRSMQ